MKIDLLIPYYPNGEIANEISDISDEKYAEMLNNYYDKEYNDFINVAMVESQDPRYSYRTVIPQKYKISAVKEQKTPLRYLSIPAQLNDLDDKPVVSLDLETFAKNGDMQAFFIHIDQSATENTDTLDELTLWTKDSKAILTDKHINEDYRLEMLPTRDLKIVFQEKKNNMLYNKSYQLNGCKIVDLDNRYNFAILTNKMIKIQ